MIVCRSNGHAYYKPFVFPLLALVFSLVVAPANGMQSTNRNGSAASKKDEQASAATILYKSWIANDLDTFESYLDAGISPHLSLSHDEDLFVDGTRVIVKAGEPISATILENSMLRPKFFEPTVRYDYSPNNSEGNRTSNLKSYFKSIVRDRRCRPSDLLLLASTEAAPGSVVFDEAFLNEFIEGVAGLSKSLNPGEQREMDSMLWTVLRLILVIDGSDQFANYDQVLTRLRTKEFEKRAWPLSRSFMDAFPKIHNYASDRSHIFLRNEAISRVRYPNRLFNEGARRVLEAIQTENPVFPEDPDTVQNELSELLESGPIESKGSSGLTLPFAAYSIGNSNAFRELCARSLDVDIRAEIDFWDLLNDSEREISAANFSPRKGDTVMLSIALNPTVRDEFLEIGLSRVRDPDIRDSLGRNMLHRLLFHRLPHNHDRFVSLLHQAGVDLNAISIGGNTPAHIAVIRNASAIPLLKSFGADLSIKNTQGLSVIDLLKQSINEKWCFFKESQFVLNQLSN